jgi:D-alanyl-D-alanine carboxypeptidase/D-alanyl-D-alanine-endopeptidase (penicillin-binding protein 4)
VDESYRRRRGTNQILVETRLPPGATEEEAITVTNPTLFFTTVLRDVLLDEGISVQGGPVDVDAIPIKPSYANGGLSRVATYTSPSMRTIATRLNEESLNLYAEQVLRTLGTAALPDAPPDLDAGTAARGAYAVRSTLARAGVDTSHVAIADGSGLSRYNLISPIGVVRLLQHMWTHPDSTVRDAFYASLPTGGQDGTLTYRFRGREAASGNVRAKTGTLSGISALSGFVTSARGTPLAFAILCNHHTTRSRNVRSGQDTIVNALARLAE